MFTGANTIHEALTGQTEENLAAPDRKTAAMGGNVAAPTSIAKTSRDVNTKEKATENIANAAFKVFMIGSYLKKKLKQKSIFNKSVISL